MTHSRSPTSKHWLVGTREATMKFIVLLAVLFAVTSVVLAIRGKNNKENQVKQQKKGGNSRGGNGGGKRGSGKKAAVKAKDAAIGKNKKYIADYDGDDEDYPEYDYEEDYFSGPEFKRGGSGDWSGSDSDSWESSSNSDDDYEDGCFHDDDPREMAGFFFSRVYVIYMPMPGAYGEGSMPGYPGPPMPGYPGPPMPGYPGPPMRGIPMPDSYYPMGSDPSSVDFVPPNSNREEYNPEMDKKMVIKSGKVKKWPATTTTTKKKTRGTTTTTTTSKPNKKTQARRKTG